MLNKDASSFVAWNIKKKCCVKNVKKLNRLIKCAVIKNLMTGMDINPHLLINRRDDWKLYSNFVTKPIF